MGKHKTRVPPGGVAHSIVRDLCERHERSNRNVTMDNFFTSYELAQEMFGNGLTVVGTVRKNKTFIPHEFQANRQREIHTNIFGFRQTMTPVSHVPKKNKAVILLST